MPIALKSCGWRRGSSTSSRICSISTCDNKEISTHLRKLLSATSKVVITDIVEVGFFSLSIERVAFGVDDLLC